MKFRMVWLPLVMAAVAVPGVVRAQEDDEPRPGMIGVVFDTDEDDVEGVRIIEVRRGSPADRAGVEEGDVVIRLNGRDADDALVRPLRLQAGDTVRLRVVRDGREQEISVVAAARPGTRFGMVRPGGREPVIIVNGDSIEVPLQALTMRIDSLHTHLLNLDDNVVRVQMDSLVRLFRDSAGVFMQRMPDFEVHVDGPDMEALALELGDLEDLAELNAEAFHFDTRVIDEALGEQPFFMELGRRAAAGAELAEMNEGLSRYFQNARSGALVIDVAANTPAARAGLEPGDVIVRAAGRDVNDPEDVRRALTRAEGDRVALEVVRQGRRRELSLEWRGADRVIRREIGPVRAPVRVRVRGQEPVVAPAPDREN